MRPTEVEEHGLPIALGTTAVIVAAGAGVLYLGLAPQRALEAFSGLARWLI